MQKRIIVLVVTLIGLQAQALVLTPDQAAKVYLRLAEKRSRKIRNKRLKRLINSDIRKAYRALNGELNVPNGGGKKLKAERLKMENFRDGLSE